MASLINKDEFARQLHTKLNAGMIEAAEPIIQKALKDTEIAMRKQLGAMLISYLDNNFVVESFSDELRIKVFQSKG